MVKIVTQLGKSRKYRNGSIHENASGKFQVMDRFLDDGIVMLKIQWLSGEKEGEIETNKEENLNASIYKYEQSRGLIGKIEENKDVVTLGDIHDAIKDLHEEMGSYKGELQEQLQENQRILKWYEEDRKAVINALELMETKLQAQANIIVDVVKHLDHNTKNIEEVLTTGAERDDNIKDIANIVDKNTNLIQTITNNLEMFQNQQKMMDKLLEKI